MNVENFIDIQSTAIMFEHTPYTYKCFHISQRQDIIMFSVVEQKALLDIKIIFETIKFIEKRKFVKYLQILISSIYLISWIYIFYKSLNTFHLLTLENIILENFQDNINPFSQTIIVKFYN